MQQMKIDDLQKFQYATIVAKDSKTGFISHQRLLVVKAGHLYYYSSVPKSFDGDPKVLQYVHELPKSSIYVMNIKKIKTPNKTSPQFEIVFDSKHMMEREDIRKTITSESFIFVPKDSNKDQVSWKFICDNHFIKQKWISIILALIDHYHLQEEKIRKYFQNLGKVNHEEKQMQRSKSYVNKNPWKQNKTYGSVKSMVDRIQDELQIGQLSSMKRDGKRDSKNLYNTYTQDVRLQQFQLTYQQKSNKIDDVFNGMKKKPKPNIAF